MAINKRKILQSAQKHVQKGNFEKACEDYQKVCKADPKDTSVRLKLGDLFLKLSRNDDAITSYLKVAEQFMKEGFDAKAVALYKQITKLDPKRHDVCVPLAELYQRMGLIPDAMAALQTAADASYQDGDKDEALALLRRMAALDPANTKNRIKVAELLHQEGYVEEAVSEYNEVLAELERQGDGEEHTRVLERLVEVDPSRTASALELARTHLGAGLFAEARGVAAAVLEHTPADLDAREIVGLALEGEGNREECAVVMRELAESYRERGDEDRARELMQRYGATTEFSTEGSDDPVLETDGAEPGADLEIDPGTPGDELGGESPEFTDPGFQPEGMHISEAIEGVSRDDEEADSEGADDALDLDIDLTCVDEEPVAPEAEAGPGDSADLDEETEPSGPLETDEAAPAAVDPVEDPVQALAEAGVYLRYGKYARAIEVLRGILAAEPDNLGALVKLGEALVASEDTANAITAFERAAAAAAEQGETTHFEEAREQLVLLDADAAAALESPFDGDAASDDTVIDDEDLDIVIDDELVDDEPDEEIDDDADEPELPDIDDLIEVESPDEQETSDVPDGVDFDLDIDVEDPVPDSEGSDPGEDLDLVGLDEEAVIDNDGAEDSADPSPNGESTTSVRVKEELEEADFFMEQGMLAEAREIFERILSMASNHPQAMLRLGEIEVALAEAELEAEPDRAESEDPAVDEDGADTVAQEEDANSPLEFVTDEAEREPGLDEAEEFTFVTDEKPPAPKAPAAEIPRTVAAPAVEPAPAAVADDGASAAAPEEHADAIAANAGDDAGGEFDLAAQLSDVFDADESAQSGVSGSTEEEGFEQVFAAFKQGVQSELGEGDHEAHYDLGIAYKEMGLLEDAISEFQQAMAAPGRELPCLHMMGLCAFDLGRTADATAHLEQALSLPNLPDDQVVGIQFDLGRAHAKAGDVERARACFEAVQAIDPDFCDVGTLLAELEPAPSAVTGTADEEAFESFDDLIASAEEETEEPAEEVTEYESFDEFMGDDEPPTGTPEPVAAEATEPIGESGELEELEPIPDEPAIEQAPASEEPPEAAADPAPAKRPRKRKKKKISFV